MLSVKLLYAISSLSYYLIYYILPYRKKLVSKNLSLSFPEKDKQEIKEISKKFYRHLCDLFLAESILAASLSEAEMKKRVTIINEELIDELKQKNRSIILMLPHYANWEWLNILPKKNPYYNLAVYKPIRNKYFDRYYKKVRERFGTETVAMDKTFRKLLDFKTKNIPVLTIFISDQRPRWAQIQLWIKFLNQNTPVITGTEKIAKKLDHAVVYLETRKKSRGHYELFFTLITDTPETTQPTEITRKYFELLEKQIHQKPEFWLWTHNRWKHEFEKFVPGKENR